MNSNRNWASGLTTQKNKRKIRSDLKKLKDRFPILPDSEIKNVYESVDQNHDDAVTILSESESRLQPPPDLLIGPSVEDFQYQELSQDLECLKQMFPEFSPSDLSEILSKCEEDMERAIEFLLDEQSSFQPKQTASQAAEQNLLDLLFDMYNDKPRDFVLKVYNDNSQNFVRTIRDLDDDFKLAYMATEEETPEEYPSLPGSRYKARPVDTRSYWFQHTDNYFLDGTTLQAVNDIRKLKYSFPAIEDDDIIKMSYFELENYQETLARLIEMFPDNYREFPNENLSHTNPPHVLHPPQLPPSSSNSIRSSSEEIKLPNPMNDKEFEYRFAIANRDKKAYRLLCQASGRAASSKQYEEAKNLAREARKIRDESDKSYKMIYMEIFRKNNPDFRNFDKIDLHQLRVNEALELLQKFIGMACNRGKQRVEVVTGKGLHSEGGVAKIKPKVLEFLKDGNYEFTSTDGGYIVRLY